MKKHLLYVYYFIIGLITPYFLIFSLLFLIVPVEEKNNDMKPLFILIGITIILIYLAILLFPNFKKERLLKRIITFIIGTIIGFMLFKIL